MEKYILSLWIQHYKVLIFDNLNESKNQKLFIKYDLQCSSILMKSLIPRFSKNMPEEAVVLKKNDTSALSSPWKVGKWRYEASVLKEAEFQNVPGYSKTKH